MGKMAVAKRAIADSQKLFALHTGKTEFSQMFSLKMTQSPLKQQSVGA